VPEDEFDADKPTVASDRLRIAKWAVWLFTAGAIGVAAYFFAKSELASDYWRSGKDYVSTQLEVIQRDGFEHWARSTKPEALKRDSSSNEGDKPADSPDVAKAESSRYQASETESKPTAVAKAAAPASAPAPALETEKSKPLAKAPVAEVAKIESGSKREAAAVPPEVSKLPEASKKVGRREGARQGNCPRDVRARDYAGAGFAWPTQCRGFGAVGGGTQPLDQNHIGNYCRMVIQLGHPGLRSLFEFLQSRLFQRSLRHLVGLAEVPSLQNCGSSGH